MSEILKSLRPSAAHRWLYCQGSPALIQKKNIEGEVKNFTLEGIAAHKLAEICLKSGLDVCDYKEKTIPIIYDDGRTPEFYPVNDDMLRNVDEYVKTAFKMSGPINEWSCEYKAKTFYGPEGTVDLVMFGKENKEIFIHDLKYGRRPVKVENNPQMLIYAKSVIDATIHPENRSKIEKVHLVIHQPNLRIVDEWETDVQYINSFADMVKITVDNIECAFEMGDELPLKAGEKQCRYCPVLAVCPQATKEVIELITDDHYENEVDPEKLKAGKELIMNCDNDHLANLMPHLDFIKSWVDAVAGRVRAELLNGNEVKGYKLVEGRSGNRAWSDEELAIRTMKSAKLKKADMYNMKIISPSQCEKKVDKNLFEKKFLKIIVRPEGQPAVVPISDKRPALEIKPIEEQFEDLTDNSDLF